MFNASQLMFMYVETPLHAGTGRSMGVVDLPLQRERLTDYPMVQASGIKGVLRSATKDEWPTDDTHRALFGPEAGDDKHDHAGALSVGDARLLLFPVRSLAGVFAWTTSRDALARFGREVAMAGFSLEPWDVLKVTVGNNEALVSGNSLIAGGQVVLEEFSFTPKPHDEVAKIGEWLAQHALPQGAEYAYWREMLPQKLCILSEDAFRDFVKYTTEVQTHIKLDPKTKTVNEGALWTTESLPTDTLLYVPLMATPSRAKEVKLSGKEVIENLVEATGSRLQVGGNQTTGQGMVAVRMYGGNGGVA